MSEKQHTTEKELVQACLKNDRSAQFELFQRFSYQLKGVCIRYMIDPDAVEDALQESFIRAFSNLKNYNFDGPLGAWLRKITVNTCLEICRKNATIKSHLDELQKDSTNFIVLSNSDDSVFQQLSAEDLIKKINQLPIGFRTIFNLYAIEGYNHEEIGIMLGISTGTSKSQYSRARLKLQEMITKEMEHENKMRYV
jgi:RNA polymerase sigma factor (sigma-70 family)